MVTGVRADYWVSNDRKFCDYCKCWLSDNKPSIAFHESGKRHKAAVAKRLSDISFNSQKAEKEKQKMDQEIRKMEEAAMRSYARDISCAGDMTARSINSVMDASGSGEGAPSGQAAAARAGQVDPMRLPGNSDDEDDNLPTVRKAAVHVQAPEASMWVEGKSDEGHTYYWNVKTNESVWKKPKEGFMTWAEYNKINEIALAQQELRQKEDAKKSQSNASEEVAKYNRERMKAYRRPDPAALTEEKREAFRTEVQAATPEIGQWQTVEHKPEAPPIDWQLPEQSYYAPPPVVVTYEAPEPPVKRFKEKTIQSLEADDAAGASSTFKKRKIARGNARQRLDDE